MNVASYAAGVVFGLGLLLSFLVVLWLIAGVWELVSIASVARSRRRAAPAPCCGCVCPCSREEEPADAR